MLGGQQRILSELEMFGLSGMGQAGLLGLFGPSGLDQGFRTNHWYLKPEADSEGWYAYINHPVPKGILCQFERRAGMSGEDQGRWVGYADFHPQFNVANLYWRLTGIGKMQMESR